MSLSSRSDSVHVHEVTWCHLVHDWVRSSHVRHLSGTLLDLDDQVVHQDHLDHDLDHLYWR